MNFSRTFYLRFGIAMIIAVLVFSLAAIPASAQNDTPTPIVIVITATPSPSATNPSSSVTLPPVYIYPAKPTCTNFVIVKAGDDLYRIGLAAGVSWPVLQALNGIPNPNLIYVGQTICLPAGANPVPLTPSITPTIDPNVTIVPTIVLPTNTPTAVAVVPTAAVTYPTIALNTYRAASGTTLTITGVNFPPNSALDVFLNPLGAPLGSPVGSVTSAGDGSLSVNFTIPSAADGTPLRGPYYSITVRARVNGYFGFTTYTNTQP